MPLFSEALGLARFATGLRAFARSPIDAAEARRIVAERMRTRDQRFLALLDAVVWPRPANPFHRLLAHAGVEAGDVHRLVEREGLEGTLGSLAREGVHVTWEEMKGRAPARRGSRTFHFRDADFDNPLIRPHYIGRSGGTLGPAVRVKVDLAFQAESAPGLAVWLDEQGWQGRPLLFWTPAHAGLANRYLMFAKIGYPYRRWFAMSDMRTLADRLRSGAVHRLSQRLLAFPAAEPADLGHAERVLDGLLERLDRGERPLVNTAPSAAARLAQLALARGRPLAGVSFLLGAEPVTAERRVAIEASGAEAWPTYGSSETGWVGSQFAGARAYDEVHVFRDSWAVVPRASDAAAVDVPAPILFTTLVRAAPKVLLNAEIGDSACFAHAPDSVPARRFGYDLTLHTIRSFRKLTAFGVTLAITDLYGIVESELPRRFGGQVGDYQLIESQDEGGVSRLTLRITPDIGPVDEHAVREALLEAIGRQRHYYGFMSDMLRRADAVGVERRTPERTVAGKLLPVVPARAESKSP